MKPYNFAENYILWIMVVTSSHVWRDLQALPAEIYITINGENVLIEIGLKYNYKMVNI